MNTSLRRSRRPFARARGCGRWIVRIAGAVAAASTPSMIQAQEGAASAGKDRVESPLETVVVTGSALRSGVRKLEASYNIVTANEEQIRDSNPRSTADLLKISPGIWPES